MRSVTRLAPFVLLLTCACSFTGGETDETPGSHSPGSSGAGGSSAYDTTWTSSRDAATLLAPTVCGGTLAAGTIDASSPVVLEDLDTGRTAQPTGLASSPDSGDGLPPVTTLTCVDTVRGPRIVVEQTMINAEQERTVRRLSGLGPSGQVEWTQKLSESSNIATIEGGAIALTTDVEGVHDHATVIDAADGSSIVNDMRLDQLEPISTNRLAYFESDTLDPVITDTKRRPIIRVSLPGRIEPRILGWVGGGGIAVLTAAQHEMTAFDAESGMEMWSLPTGEPGAGASTIDAESGVLITTDSLVGGDVPAPTGDGANTYAGIDLESGDVLWRWNSDNAPSDLVAAGGAFAAERLGAGYGGAAAVFDSRTGIPIELDDGLTPVALTSDGVLVADGAKLQLMSR